MSKKLLLILLALLLTPIFLYADDSSLGGGNIGGGFPPLGFKTSTSDVVRPRTVEVSLFDDLGNGAIRIQTGGGVSSQWTTTGSDIYYNLGNIGIGTSSPIYPLQVAGTTASQTLRFGTLYDNLLPAGTGATGQYLQPNGTGSIIWANTSAGGGGGSTSFAATNPQAILYISSGNTASNTALTVVDTNGNIGIGTSSPLGLLQVGTDPTIPGLIVLSNNKVGIGMSNPITALDVKGIIRVNKNAGAGNLMLQLLSGITEFGGLYGETSDELSIKTSGATGLNFLTNNQYRMFIDSNGNVGIGNLSPVGLLQAGNTAASPGLMVTLGNNVGIGTTNPYEKLLVSGGDAEISAATPKFVMRDSDTATAYALHLDTATGAPYGYLQFWKGIDTGTGFSVTPNKPVWWSDNSGNFNSGSFSVNNSTGNIGIGTTNPQSILQVYENTTASDNVGMFFNDIDATGEYNHIAVGRTNSNDNAALFGYLYSTTVGNEGAIISVWGDAPQSGQGIFVKKGGNVGIGDTAPIGLLQIGNTHGSPGLIVLKSGNVGIGNTNPDAHLVVGTNIGMGLLDAEIRVGVAAGNNKYARVVVGQDSTHYTQFVWYDNATAGNAYAALGSLSGSNPLLLQDGGGNVGIGSAGATMPWERLTVSGGDQVISATSPKITLRDSSDNTAYSLHLDTATTAPYGYLQFWKGTDTSTGFNVSPSKPIWWSDNSGNFNSGYLSVNNTSGNVGIGTSSPTAKLHIKGSGVNAGWALHIDDFAGTDRVVIQENGNVGIGTTAPLALLQIGTSPGTATLTVTGGNVGIGTTNPTTVMTIVGASTAPANCLYLQDNTLIIKKSGTCVQMQLTISGTTATYQGLVVTCP